MRRQEDEAKGPCSPANSHPNPKPAAIQPANLAYVSPWRTAQRWLSLYFTPVASEPPKRTWQLPERHPLHPKDQLKPAALHRAQGATLAHYLASDPLLPAIRWIQLAVKLCHLALETEFKLTFNLQTIHYDAANESLSCLNAPPEFMTTQAFTQIIAELLGFTLHQSQLIITAKTLSRLLSRELCETLQAFLQDKLPVIAPLQTTHQDFMRICDIGSLQCGDVMSAIRKVALVDIAEYHSQRNSVIINALHYALQAADQVMLIDLHHTYQNEYGLIEKNLLAAGVKCSHKIIFTKNVNAKLESILLKLSRIPHLGNGDPGYYFFVTTRFFSESWINHLKRHGLSPVLIDLQFRKNDYETIMQNEIMMRRSDFLIHHQINYVLYELRAEVKLIHSTYLAKPTPFLIRESAHANLDTLNYVINQLDGLLVNKKTSFEEIMEIIGPLTPIILHRMNKIMQMLLEQKPNARYQQMRPRP